MNTFWRAAPPILAFATLVAAPAAAKAKRGVPQYREIHSTTLGDGVYTIPNRSVVCRVFEADSRNIAISHLLSGIFERSNSVPTVAVNSWR